MNPTKKILLLAYKFPPYEGVGARRWAKFVKYFLKQDKKIFVVTNNWKTKGVNSWTHDVKNDKQLILKKFQTVFNVLRSDVDFFNKVLFKIEIALSNKFIWTDEAYLFYKLNYKRIKNIIRENKIKYVVATGGPFSTNYFAAKLKHEMPDIFLIQDFRDLWTEEYFTEYPSRGPQHPFYGMEQKMEAYSLKYCDLVVSVTPGYLQRLKAKALSYGIHSQNYALLENGFDNDDKRNFADKDYPSTVFSKGKLNICHFGTAGFGRETEFIKFLNSIKQSLINVSKGKILFHFFGIYPNKFISEITRLQLEEVVCFHGLLSPKEVQRFMFFSDMHLVINDPVCYYAFGTKVYDAFMYKKPVLLICKEDELYRRILDNNLGLVTNNEPSESEKVISFLNLNFKEMIKGNIFNRDFDFGQFSIETLAERYLSYLK